LEEVVPFTLSNRFSRPARTPALYPSRWAQPAALVALLALSGSVWVIASELALDIGGLVAALLCVFIMAFSGWFVVTRRGLVRLLGIPGVLLGIIGLGAYFVAERWPLLIVLGCVTLFVFASRYAVRHDRTAVRAVHRSWRRVKPAQTGVLIINPNSGEGKANRFDLLAEARKRGVQPLLLEPGADLRELATTAVANGADVIGMAGGDGSQATVARVAMEHDVAHVCVPAGTRNHFALDLGLDRDDVVGALDAFTDGVERRIDLASVNGHIFVNNASIGLYAEVVQEGAYRDAKMRTWQRRLPEMLGPDAKPIDIKFKGPDARIWTGAAVILVSNNPYQLKHLAGAGTRPRLDTGRLGILAVRVRGARDLAKLVTLQTVGQSRRFKGLFEWSCPEFEVRSTASIPVGLDGEALLLAPPLRFVSLPGVMRVRVPRRASRVSPAGSAVALTRSDVSALVRIAVGRRGASTP
jgi:diacylglycerol kinase family enzyme